MNICFEKNYLRVSVALKSSNFVSDNFIILVLLSYKYSFMSFSI